MRGNIRLEVVIGRYRREITFGSEVSLSSAADITAVQSIDDSCFRKRLTAGPFVRSTLDDINNKHGMVVEPSVCSAGPVCCAVEFSLHGNQRHILVSVIMAGPDHQDLISG